MLIDEYLPTYDVSERHSTRVAATLERTFDAIQRADFSTARLMNVLLTLRGMGSPRREAIRLDAITRHGFRLLAVQPAQEIVIGLEGQFWRLSGNVCTPAEEAFRSTAPPPHFVRAVWNFSLESDASGGTVLSTETRVLCADAHARYRFLPYWYAIRLGSGLIRRSMLDVIRKEAEGLTGS